MLIPKFLSKANNIQKWGFFFFLVLVFCVGIRCPQENGDCEGSSDSPCSRQSLLGSTGTQKSLKIGLCLRIRKLKRGWESPARVSIRSCSWRVTVSQMCPAEMWGRFSPASPSLVQPSHPKSTAVLSSVLNLTFITLARQWWCRALSA